MSSPQTFKRRTFSSRFSEEKEVGLLLQLITCHPPPSAAGVRFVSIGLCTLIACPSLIALPDNEKRASEWIRWLVKEEAYFAGYVQQVFVPGVGAPAPSFNTFLATRFN